MYSALQLKPGDVDTPEKRSNYTVGIIGCGRIGIFHAWLSVERGFKVCCADADRTIINNILKGKLPFMQNEIAFKLKSCAKSGQLKAIIDIKEAASLSDIIVLTVPVEVDENKKIDHSKIEAACKYVGLGLKRGSTIIITSTLSVGFTQFMIKENLENSSGLKCGIDFGLAYSPLQSSAEQTPQSAITRSRILAAFDKNSLNSAATFLESIVPGGIKKTLNVKTAEALTLFEAVRSDVNNAFAKEFASFCERSGVDFAEVAQLAAENTESAESPIAFFDGAASIETLLFLEDSENLSLKAKMPKAAMEINKATAKHAANLVRDALKGCSKSMRRARIAILGVAHARNARSPPKDAANELIQMLNAKGARLNIYDPYISMDEFGKMPNLKRSLAESLDCADCAVIVTGHDEFKHLNLRELKVIMKMPAALVDLEGILEPFEVEKEGFLYRGFGRGMWTK